MTTAPDQKALEVVAVDETSPLSAGIELCSVDGRSMAKVVIDGKEVFFSARCPHKGASMSEGRVVGNFVVCGRHGATFDLRTGSWLRGPACPDIRVLGATNNRESSDVANTADPQGGRESPAKIVQGSAEDRK